MLDVEVPESARGGEGSGITRCRVDVEEPDQIRPAIERAFASGRPALVNVKTDPLARASSAKYTAKDMLT